MSEQTSTAAGDHAVSPAHIAARLRPLLIGVFLQNFGLWVPVEKMFMTRIGFDAVTIAIAAAVYAAVVPLLEVPFGVLADRWSRTGMMALASVALAASALVGGLSTGPAMYMASAALLGVYFALNSGTADSIVYDTLVEQTGASTTYQRWIGRLHAVEAAALVSSAALGGVVAALGSLRVTYFATVPVVIAAVVVLSRCREPGLHRVAERTGYLEQATATLRALGGSAAVRHGVMLAALAAVASQLLIEFGPLWLVRMHAPAVLYGPYWAGLLSTIGLGAWLASRVPFHRPLIVAAFGAAMSVAAVVISVGHSLPEVIAAQVVVALAMAVIGVRAGFLLHEATAPTIRAGVSSGASTLSWIVFLPVSLMFGWLAHAHGMSSAGGLLTLVTVAVAALLTRSARPTSQPAPSTPELALASA